MMENNFKQGQAVLIKAVVDYGNAKPGKMVRIRTKDSGEEIWVKPSECIHAGGDKCGGNILYRG